MITILSVLILVALLGYQHLSAAKTSETDGREPDKASHRIAADDEVPSAVDGAEEEEESEDLEQTDRSMSPPVPKPRRKT